MSKENNKKSAIPPPPVSSSDDEADERITRIIEVSMISIFVALIVFLITTM